MRRRANAPASPRFGDGGRSVAACLVLACLAVVSRSAWSNDSEAELVGGHLTLKKSDGIVMESEDLRIAEDLVGVAYVFRNTTLTDVSTGVAFPLAPFPLESPDDAAEEVRAVEGALRRDFKPVVDGQARAFDVETRWIGDTLAATCHWKQVFPAGGTVSIEHRYAAGGGFALAYRLLNEKDARSFASSSA